MLEDIANQYVDQSEDSYRLAVASGKADVSYGSD